MLRPAPYISPSHVIHGAARWALVELFTSQAGVRDALTLAGAVWASENGQERSEDDVLPSVTMSLCGIDAFRALLSLVLCSRDETTLDEAMQTRKTNGLKGASHEFIESMDSC